MSSSCLLVKHALHSTLCVQCASIPLDMHSLHSAYMACGKVGSEPKAAQYGFAHSQAKSSSKCLRRTEPDAGTVTLQLAGSYKKRISQLSKEIKKGAWARREESPAGKGLWVRLKAGKTRQADQRIITRNYFRGVCLQVRVELHCLLT